MICMQEHASTGIMVVAAAKRPHKVFILVHERCYQHAVASVGSRAACDFAGTGLAVLADKTWQNTGWHGIGSDYLDNGGEEEF